MFEIFYDLRSSIRTLRRRPFYPLMAVIIMALGLSASVAVFTYVNGFYQPFPGVDAGGLVRVFGVDDEVDAITFSSAYYSAEVMWVVDRIEHKDDAMISVAIFLYKAI